MNNIYFSLFVYIRKQTNEQYFKYSVHKCNQIYKTVLIINKKNKNK